MSQMGNDFGMGGDTSAMGGATPEKTPVKADKNIIFRLMGGFNSDKDPTDTASKAYSTRLSSGETTSRIRSMYVRPETQDKLSQQGIITFVQPVHDEIAKAKFESKRFRVLAPEIEQAALILVSSILSPNDLQFTSLNFDIENDKLTADTKQKICDVLSSYFNDQYDIGTKLQEWYKECLFKSGSQPILILPDTKFQELKDRPIASTDISSFSSNIGTERYTGNKSMQYVEDRINDLTKESIYSDAFALEDFRSELGTVLTTKGLESLRKENKEAFREEFITPLMSDIESILQDDLNRLYPITDDMPRHVLEHMNKERTKFMDEITTALEDTTINVITKINDGDVFRISENPEILRFHSNYSLQRRYNLTQRLNQFWNKKGYTPYKNEPITPISEPEEGDGDKTKFYPADMRLPPESVMPICIPGDKKTHIAYMLICDQFGHPLIAEEDAFDNTECGDGAASKAFNTMFGPPTRNTFFRLGHMTKANLTSKVFEHLLDKYLKAKIDKIGIGDMDISKYNAIMQVMFRRLLFHKKTIIVFIPETYITYYAFDYRDDGTGKSKLEDVSFILHLRTTFFVAKIMAMMKDAINHRTVTVDLDDKVANPDQLLQQVKEIFIAKQSMTFNSNPADIVRAINDQALSIQANNYPGLQNFKVEHNSTPTTTQAPDDNLLDTLNTLFIDFLDVPHSALNQLSENEYARSIVSNHLFFAKKITGYQKTANGHNDKLVQVYTRYAKPLRTAIEKIINKDGSGTETVPTTTGGDSSKISVDEIIDGIRTTLPTPKIAPDKAQFEEIRGYVDAIGGLIDLLFSDDMLPDVDSDTKQAMALLRGYYKAYAARQIYEAMGVDNIVNIPELDESLTAQNQLHDIYQTAKNIKNGMAAAKAAQDRYADPEQTFQGDSGGGMGMDGDFGMGDDMGMGGDMGMDMGGDMGGDLGGGDFGASDMSMPDTSGSDTEGTPTSGDNDNMGF